MQKPLLLWDFDGVMADSTNFVFSYWQQQLNQAGYKFEIKDYQATFTYKFPFDYLHEKFGDVAPQIYKDYSAYEHQNYATNVEPFSGFIEGFLNMADQYEHHIISSNLASVINPWLDRHNLRHCFKSVIGREMTGYKNEKITTLLQQQKRGSRDVIFIGDTVSDIAHGQAAGVQTIGVSWGVHNKAMLEGARPHKICDTIDELFHHLA